MECEFRKVCVGGEGNSDMRASEDRTSEDGLFLFLLEDGLLGVFFFLTETLKCLKLTICFWLSKVMNTH